MPLGVTSCTEDIFRAFLSDEKIKTFFHGHSYTANPVSCSAALASLDLLLTDECQKNIERISGKHAAFAETFLNNHGIKNVRTRGTIIAFEIENEEGTSYFNSVRDELYNHFLADGILLRPLGNTLYIMPPYCISDEDLSCIYRCIREKLFNEQKEMV
jgi:adenosylmethionine-8-amino-7-oxononanoate aminotransferase